MEGEIESMRGEAGKERYLLCFVALWVLQMAAALWFCTQKQGFHEDEYYTYYSTARTNGFYVEDGQWMDRDTYRNEFVVLPGQGFQYGLVKQVQSWDVHPPMYYWVFHTVASFVPGVFSKWIGLSVNLFFHGINLILLTYLSYLITEGDEKLSLLVTFVYGFSPASMSGVVFIRMYEMLTTFVLLSAVLHVRAVKRVKEIKKQAFFPVLFVLMAAVTYVGFLTQYYYFIFQFFLSASFCIWLLWRDRKLWNCLRYGLCQVAVFGLAYLTYPSFPAQMFRGQRGAQATESFFDLSNTFGRFGFFGDLMNRYVFGGLLGYMLLLIAAAIAVCLWGMKKRRGILPQRIDAGTERLRQECDAEFGAAYYILLIAVFGYFVAVSKTALLLGETSVRYQLPIYGIAVLLVFSGVGRLWRYCVELTGICSARGENLSGAWRTRAAGWLAAAFCIIVVAAGYLRNDVVFLYPEDREQTAWAAEWAAEHVLAVFLYQLGEEWCVWDVTDELLAYPEIYFAKADGADEIVDEKIDGAEALVVYLAKGADAKAQLARFMVDGNASAEDELQPVFEEKYCDVYYLRR